MAKKSPIPDPVIAGITGSPTLVAPDARSRAANLQKVMSANATDGGVVTIDAEKLIMDAWRYVRDKCAAHKPCNAYFSGLPAGKTLEAVMLEGNIVICRLDPPPPNPIRPSARKTDDDMAKAITAGRQIAINPLILFAAASNLAELSATLVHEIAHIAGASTNPRDPSHALDAETALKACLMPQMFDPNAMGLLSRVGPARTT